MKKGEAHKKAIYGREIIPRLHGFVKSFWRDFSKLFSSHGAHNPETRRTFVFHRVRQKQDYFKLPPFCFFAENDFESDFEIESENEFKFKIGFESDFESENVLCFTWNLITKSPFMGRKLYYRDSVLSRTFFKKVLAHLPPESQKKRPPKRSFLPSY